MPRASTLLTIIIFFFLQIDCKKEPTIVPPDELQKEITLTLQDTTCTEAWLQLSFKNYSLPHNYKIFRDSNLAFSGLLFSNDTTLIDTTLLPKRNYHYKAIRFENGSAKDSSKIFQVTTMDTTSHDFVFTVDTLGANGSILNDVAIIDANNIWVVGQIYVKDSTGTVVDYNAARWDGVKWNLIAIPLKIWGTTATIIYKLQTIIVFNSTDIYVTDGQQIVHYNGQQWGEWNFLFTNINDTSFGDINKFWGTSANDFWGVGNKGNIFHFNKTSWKRQNVFPTMDLRDIAGTSDGKTIITSGINLSTFQTGLFRYQNGNWNVDYDGSSNIMKVLNDTISGAIYSIFQDSDNRFYAMTFHGLYRFASDTKGEGKRLWKPGASYLRYVEDARGEGNNVFIIGDDGLVHYNGYSWKTYEQFRFQNSGYILRGIAYSLKIKVVVGWAPEFVNEKGIVIRIKQQ